MGEHLIDGELHVFSDDSEYVIAYDVEDVLLILSDMRVSPPFDVEWTACDESTSFTFTGDDGDGDTKTFGEWAKERGRGYFCAEN